MNILKFFGLCLWSDFREARNEIVLRDMYIDSLQLEARDKGVNVLRAYSSYSNEKFDGPIFIGGDNVSISNCHGPWVLCRPGVSGAYIQGFIASSNIKVNPITFNAQKDPENNG